MLSATFTKTLVIDPAIFDFNDLQNIINVCSTKITITTDSMKVEKMKMTLNIL